MQFDLVWAAAVLAFLGLGLLTAAAAIGGGTIPALVVAGAGLAVMAFFTLLGGIS